MAPYTAMSKPYFQGLRAAVVEHFLDSFGMIPLNDTMTTGFELCYDVDKYGGADVFMSRAPIVMLHPLYGAQKYLRLVCRSGLSRHHLY
ncbi:hypothetical protein ACLB2K_056526 [Fragaria x ananassa]